MQPILDKRVDTILGGVYGSAGCTAAYEVYVIMISRTLPGELARDAWASLKSNRGLQDWPKGRPNTAGRSWHHTKLAHVSSYLPHIWVPLEPGHHVHLLAGGQPGVLVKDVPAICPVVLVDRRAEPHVLLGLPQQFLERFASTPCHYCT